MKRVEDIDPRIPRRAKVQLAYWYAHEGKLHLHITKTELDIDRASVHLRLVTELYPSTEWVLLYLN